MLVMHLHTCATVCERVCSNASTSFHLEQLPGQHGAYRFSRSSVNRSMSRSVTSHKLATTHGLPAEIYAAVGPVAAELRPLWLPKLAEEHPIKSAAGDGNGKWSVSPLSPVQQYVLCNQVHMISGTPVYAIVRFYVLAVCFYGRVKQSHTLVGALRCV